MRISLDGGAICSKEELHFGNYSFTKNLIEAFQRYDQVNNFYVYSFCPKPAWLKTNEIIKYKILHPRPFWLSTRVGIEEIREKKDIFLALNQAIPIKTSKKVISFSHGLSFYYFPQYYPDSYHALKDQLEPMVKRSRYVIVASRKVKIELKKIFPDYKNFITINYGIPFDMLKDQIRKRKKFFLFVGMNHKIKNIEFIIKAFGEFKKSAKFNDYKLYLVGNLKQFEDKQNGIFAFPELNREKLRTLYSEATACLTASFYESFNFPVLEASAQNCPVIGLSSAIIPEFTDLATCVNDSDEFVARMIESCETQKKINKKDLLTRFSWKKYVNKLEELYK